MLINFLVQTLKCKYGKTLDSLVKFQPAIWPAQKPISNRNRNFESCPDHFYNLLDYVSGYSLILMFQGVSTIVGAPVAGLIYETTGNYDFCFYVSGSYFILASVFSFAAQILHKVKN